MARKGQSIEILSGWQEGLGEEDFLRELVQRTVQQVLEAEMTSFLGAESYQRNDVRRGWRNGYKPRTLKTRVGELELMVPKDRDGEFQTELFERYQRSEKALVLAMLEMYVGGVSTQGERDHRGAVRAGGVQEPGVVADGEAGRGDRGVADASPDAGVSVPGGGRALRACASGRRGGEPGRAGGVRHRRAWLPRGAGRVGGGVRVRGELGRGVRGAEAAWAQRRSYVVSDDHAGMVKAIGRHFQGAVWQRCQVHFVRNALSLCGVAQRPLVLSLMRSVTEAGTRDAARAALKTAVAELQKKAPKTALLLEEHGEEILGVYALPEPHRKRMRTTNMLERQNQELKRRTRVVRVFPNGQSCLRLVSALLIETSQQWMERLYLRMEEEPADQTDAQAA